MRPELRKEVLRIAKALGKGEWQAAHLRPGRSMLEIEAIEHLKSSGLITAEGKRPPFLTDKGDEFLQESNASWLYRFIKNWSAWIIPIVAAVISGATGAAITFFLTC